MSQARCRLLGDQGTNGLCGRPPDRGGIMLSKSTFAGMEGRAWKHGGGGRGRARCTTRVPRFSRSSALLAGSSGVSRLPEPRFPRQFVSDRHGRGPRRRAALARAFAASTSRFLDGALVTRESTSVRVSRATLSTARSNAARLTREGRGPPMILRTYWRAAAWTSSFVAGGSKLWRVLMLRHMAHEVKRALRTLVTRCRE